MTPNMSEQIIRFCVLYRIKQGEQIPFADEDPDRRKLDSALLHFYAENIIRPKDNPVDDYKTAYVVTEKGDAILEKARQVYERALPFNIFADVDFSIEYSYDGSADPRFAETAESLDMRIAMLNYYAAQAKVEIYPELIVTIQKMVDGIWAGPDFWFNLANGIYLNEVSEIVRTHHTVQALWPGNTADWYDGVLKDLYQSGMEEYRRRNEPPDVMEDVFNCGKCSAEIDRTMVTCLSCGEGIAWNGKPSTYQETVVTEETVVETHTTVAGGYYYYDTYYPVYYYDPYYISPIDAVVLCCLLF